MTEGALVYEIRNYIKIQDRWMTKKELAAYWRISPRSIDRLITAGLPMELRFGKRLIMLSDADKWYDEHSQDKGRAA